MIYFVNVGYFYIDFSYYLEKDITIKIINDTCATENFIYIKSLSHIIGQIIDHEFLFVTSILGKNS